MIAEVDANVKKNIINVNIIFKYNGSIFISFYIFQTESLGSIFLFTLLFSEDALNWLKVTVKLYIFF